MSQQPVWAARTGRPDEAMLAYGASIEDDAVLLPYDVAGSIAHVHGLRQAGLLAPDEADALVQALQACLAEHHAGTWRLDSRLEDGHMNLEARLTSMLGDAGRRVHTGRSRNDQVATAIVLFARNALQETLAGACALGEALLAQAAQHARTPWAARTHGRPAQPATLGWLLLAHAMRLQDAADATAQAFERIGESPLGSGAVAGSTLPLDPAATARILGLRPPRHALLATGTRDTARHAVDAMESLAHVTASLAEDLLQLFHQGALTCPAGLTTGSSVMPHKRNPDALELARAHSRALMGHRVALAGITLGQPLGYHRDFQLVKPHLIAAARLPQTLAILASCVEGGTFHTDVLEATMDQPGLGATDAVETLVEAGLPFRDAYTAIARAFQDIEAGAAPHDAFLAHAPQHADACLAALTPDPMRRTTLGAPATMPAMLAEARATQARLQQACDAARKATRTVEALLA